MFADGESSPELQSVEIEVLVGGCADEDLVDVLCIDFSVVGEVQSNFLVKLVDEEIKKLVFVEFTVCLLLVFGHIHSKQTF